MIKERYYIAYGSNLSVRQMAYRCPDATIVGIAALEGWQLRMRTHATIEKNPGSCVPVLIWKISAQDEKRLDLYEGYPSYYYKKELPVSVTPLDGGASVQLDAMVYLMVEGRPLAMPSQGYYETLKEGYARFGFPIEILEKAMEEVRV